MSSVEDWGLPTTPCQVQHLKRYDSAAESRIRVHVEPATPPDMPKRIASIQHLDVWSLRQSRLELVSLMVRRETKVLIK